MSRATIEIHGTSIQLRSLYLDERKRLLVDAQKDMLSRAVDGTDCPCCGRTVRVYRRNVYRSLAEALLFAYRDCKTEWFHKPSVVTGETSANKGGDFLKLRYWGFIERFEATREDGSKRNGYWRITETGQAFILGKVDAPKYAYEFDGECIALSAERTTFADCFGSPGFVYHEILV